MKKKQTNQYKPYESIKMELIPKAVKTNPLMFNDDIKYNNYSKNQLDKYFNSLGKAGYVTDLIKDTKDFRNMEYSEKVSVNQISLKVIPDYYLLKSQLDKKTLEQEILDGNRDNIIICPSFNLTFKPSTLADNSQIVGTALKQFYLLSSEIKSLEDVSVRGYKKNDESKQGLKVLKDLIREAKINVISCYMGKSLFETYYLIIT